MQKNVENAPIFVHKNVENAWIFVQIFVPLHYNSLIHSNEA